MMERSRKKNLFFALIIFSCVFALLEAGARLFYRVDEQAVFNKHQKIIKVLGLPDLAETMEFDPDLFWTLKPNLRDYPVSGRIRSNEIEFFVSTNKDRLRNPPVEPEKEEFRILAIGDSCTFGVGVNDNETWPVQLERIMSRTRPGTVEVINAGVPGYTAYQGKRFLMKEGFLYLPDLVIASFGFNDAEVWGCRTDPETAHAFQVSYWKLALEHSRFYQLLKRQIPRNRNHGLKDKADRHPSSRNRPRLTPEQFRRTLQSIHQMCKVRGIPVVFLIWPYRDQVKNDDERLLKYQPIIYQFGRDYRVPVINLIKPFIASGEDLFLDHGHASPMGCRIVSETIGQGLERMGIKPDPGM